MKIILASLFLLFINIKVKSQQNQSLDSSLYISDFSSKIFGEFSVVFVEIHDGLALATTFKIYFSKDEVIKVRKSTNSHLYKFLNKNNGIIYVEGLHMECYTSTLFEVHRRNSDKIYELISPQFWNLDNHARRELINNLSE